MARPSWVERHFIGLRKRTTSLRSRARTIITAKLALPNSIPVADQLYYPYQPLDSTSNEIRLFTLLPGKGRRAIEGRLTHHNFDTSLEYDALSYMWGDPTKTRIIRIDGHDTGIAENLFLALNDIRQTKTPLVIWIDALCINQDDNEELNHQVQQMRTIYSKAAMVHAWIDEQIDPNDWGVQEINRFAQYASDNPEEAAQLVSRVNGYAEDMDKPDFARLLGGQPERWKPVAELLNDPYWHRLWIQQELILAHQVIFHCRKTLVSTYLTDIFSVVLMVASLRNAMPHTSLDRQYLDHEFVPSLAILRVGRSGQSPESTAIDGECATEGMMKFLPKFPFAPGTLLSNLHSCRGLKAANQRDYVHGLLGMSSDVEPGDIEVNYEDTIAQTYTKTVSFGIEKYGRLDPLCCVTHGKEKPELDWPSWVPDWSDDSMILDPYQFDEYKAGMLALDKCSLPIISEEGCRLRNLRGMRIGTIEAIGKLLDGVDCTAQDCLREVARLLPGIFDKELDAASIMTLTWSVNEIEPFTSHPIAALSSMKGRRMTVEFCLQRYGMVPDGILAESEHENEEFAEIYEYVIECSICPMLGVSLGEGRWGVAVESDAKHGDEVWIVFGCPKPLILRPNGDDHIVISNMYLQGVMEGEAVKGLDDIRAEQHEVDGRVYQIETLSFV